MQSGIEILAIISGSPEDAEKAKKLSSAKFEIKADVHGSMMDQFGLRDSGGNPFTGEDAAQPATVLVSRDGKLLWAKYSQNYRVRMKPDELLRVAKEALSTSRAATQ